MTGAFLLTEPVTPIASSIRCLRNSFNLLYLAAAQRCRPSRVLILLRGGLRDNCSFFYVLLLVQHTTAWCVLTKLDRNLSKTNS